MMSPIYKLTEDSFLIPGFHPGLKIETLKALHSALVNLYSLRYNEDRAEKSTAFKYLYNTIYGESFDNSSDAIDKATKLLNDIALKNLIGVDEVAKLISGTEFASIVTSSNINIKNLEKVSAAIKFSQLLTKLETVRALEANNTETRDEGVLRKAKQDFVDSYSILPLDLKNLFDEKLNFGEKDLQNISKVNPKVDVNRLLSLFQNLSRGSGQNPNDPETKQTIDAVIDQLVNLTGIKKIVTESIPEAVAIKLRDLAEVEKNTNLRQVIQSLLKVESLKGSRLKILDLTEADIKSAIEANKLQFQKTDGSQWSDQDSVELENLFKKTFFRLKSESIIDNYFGGNSDAFFTYIVKYYDSLKEIDEPKANKLAFSLDRLKNETELQDEVYSRVLSNNEIIDNFLKASSEKELIKSGYELYEKVYLQNTFSAQSSGKLVININELEGYYSNKYKQGFNLPNKKLLLEKTADDLEKISVVFGSKAQKYVAREIVLEAFSKKNIYHTYKDRIDSGVLSLDFEVINGKIVFTDPEVSSIAVNIISKLGYSLLDLGASLDDIPGIYFKAQTSEQAISLDFVDAQARRTFLDNVRSKGKIVWDDVVEANYIKNLDFREAIINQTGNLNYIKEDSVFTFNTDKLPRYYGLSNENDTISDRVKSIVDAADNLELKIGKLGGALFKAYFLARYLPGLVSDIDENLKKTVFALDIIDTIDQYIKDKTDITEKTFVLQTGVYNEKQIEQFKNNGDLYNFTFVEDYEDRKGQGYKVYTVEPKKDFKERALNYLEKEKTLNLYYLLPLTLRDSSPLDDNGLDEVDVPTVSNIALYTGSSLSGTNTTGTGLARYVITNIRQSYSEDYYKKAYLEPLKIGYNGINIEESDFVSLFKNKTYKEILSMGNDLIKGVPLRSTVYYEMLQRFLIGSKKISDTLISKDTGIKELNEDVLNLNSILSNPEVRSVLAEELQTILKDTNIDKSLDLLSENDPRLTAIANKINSILDKQESDTPRVLQVYTGKQAGKENKDFNGRTRLDSYSVASLGIKNEITSRIKPMDIFDIYENFTKNNEFKQLSQITLEAKVDETAAKVKALTSVANQNQNNKSLSIFIDDLYRINTNEFNSILNYLKETGLVTKSSLDLFEKKYKEVSDTTYFNKVFEDKLDTDYIYQTKLASYHNVPSAEVSNTFSIWEGTEYGKKFERNYLKNFREKPGTSTNGSNKAIKIAATDISKDHPLYSFINNLKNSIESDLETKVTSSRLIQNLEHQEFLGKLVYNVSGLANTMTEFFKQNNINIKLPDAVKIAFRLFNETTGVNYDRFYSSIFFYDTKTNELKAVSGSGSDRDALGFVANAYMKDYASVRDGSVIGFQVDRDSLLSADSNFANKIKYFILDENNAREMRSLVNKFVHNQIKIKTNLDLPHSASEVQKRQTVLSSYLNQSDRLDLISSVIAKLKLPADYNRKLVKNLFYNGRNVAIGSDKLSLNATKTINTLSLGDPNYRTDNVKRNNLEQSLNDALLLIDVDQLPKDYIREVNQMAKDFELSLSKDNNYRKNVTDTVKLIFKTGTKGLDARNFMEAFALKNPDNKNQFLKDVVALYILKKNTGQTHNFILLDNNIDELIFKASSSTNLKFNLKNGETLDSKEVLSKDFFVGDIENAFFKDNNLTLPLVLEMTLKKYKGIQNVEEFNNSKRSLNEIEDKSDTITIPAFYKDKLLNRDLINELTSQLGDKATLEQRIELLFPEYYSSFFVDNKEASLKVWDKYLSNVNNIVNKYGITKQSQVGEYLLNRSKALGFNENSVLISFNGKFHDFGTEEKDGVLTQAGILPRENQFQNKHIDLFNDIWRTNRYDVSTFDDQQKSSLISIAKKLGIENYVDAHTSEADVDVTAKIAIKLLANISNSNKFTSNLINVLDDLASNLGFKKGEYDYKDLTSSVKKIDNSYLNQETKEFINNYKYAFDRQNIAQFDKAFNTIINSLKDYLDSSEREIKRKQVYNLVKDELGNRYNFYDKIQEDSSTFRSIFEYLLSKQERFQQGVKFDDNNLISKSEDGKGGLLRLFDLFRNSFGDETISEDGKPIRTISALGYERIFSLQPEVIFDTIIKSFETTPTKGYGFLTSKISYEDYLNNKEKYSGENLKNYVDNLRSKENSIVSRINNEEESARLNNKLSFTYSSLFENVVKGFNEDVANLILNEAATPLLKNASLSKEDSSRRIKNSSVLKLDDSKFLTSLKNIINESTFGSTFEYRSFYEQANQADYFSKYTMQDGSSQSIGANEIGLTAKRYEEMTGLSYDKAKALFNGQVYLNVIRHPVDKPGSIVSLKVKLLASDDVNNKFTTLVNIDTLYSALAGDVDGDYITIVTPTKGTVDFNRRLFNYNRRGNGIISEVISSLSSPKFVDDSEEVKLSLFFDEAFKEKIIQQKDRQRLESNEISFEKLKEERLQQLKELIIKMNGNVELAEKVLKNIWLTEYTLGDLILKGKVYYTPNRKFTMDNQNSLAFKQLSIAKAANYNKLAFADEASGLLTKMDNYVGERIVSENLENIINYSAFGLTERTQSFINENLEQVKSLLVENINKKFNNKELALNEQRFNAIVGLIKNAENSTDISSSLHMLDASIFKSKEFSTAYKEAMKSFSELDKDLLESRENYNINVLKNYAKSMGIDLSNVFGLTQVKEALYRELADYSGANFWSSTGSSKNKKKDLQRALSFLEDSKNNVVENNYILHEEKVAGMRDEKGFKAPLHSNVIVIFDSNKYSDSLPLAQDDVYLYVKKSLDKLSSKRFILYTVPNLDKIFFDYYRSEGGMNKPLKADYVLSSGKVIPSGSIIHTVKKEKNGSYSLKVYQETKFQPGTKIVSPGTKNFKSTNGGEAKGKIADIIESNQLPVDFVYGSANFKYKNINPLSNSFYQADMITYYKTDSNNKLIETNQLDAEFALFKEIPMQTTQIFYDTDIKTNVIDDIIISTSKRNIYGNVFLGDSFMKINPNNPEEIVFDSLTDSKLGNALNLFNQPTLIANNAAYLHGMLINSIALKYSGLSKAEVSEELKRFTTNFDLSSKEAIGNFWSIIETKFDNDIENLYSKVNDFEKVILSDNLYLNFFDQNNGVVIKNEADFEMKSKTKAFRRETQGFNSMTERQMKIDGELARYNSKKLNSNMLPDDLKGALVFDSSFGYISTLDYLNFIINSVNNLNIKNKDYKKINIILSKDVVDGSLKNILNVGLGISSSISEGFTPVNLRDALIERNPENYSSYKGDQKAGYVLKGDEKVVETSKFFASPFSQVKKPNAFALMENNFTNNFYGDSRTFDSNKGFLFDARNSFSRINTNETPSSGTNLRGSEVRFLKNLFGISGTAKNIFERAALFGFDEEVNVPLSITGISLDDSNQVRLGYGNDFLRTKSSKLLSDVQDKINSFRFFDLVNYKKDSLEKNIKEAISLEKADESKARNLEQEYKDKVDGLNIFKKVTTLSNEETSPEKIYEVDLDFKHKVLLTGENEKLSTVFKEDWLRSGLFNVVNTDQGLSLEVERAVRDYQIQPSIFLNAFSEPLKDLYNYAASYKVVDKLNVYAASKYYSFAIQKITNSLNDKGISESDKVSLNILKETYLEDFKDLKTGFQTTEDFVNDFEKIYGNVVNQFNRVNYLLGKSFKEYSVLTDEATENLFYILKPKVRKGLEKEEKLFQRLNMFTYNDEKNFESVDLATYNYFDNTYEKLNMLSKQATVVRLSEKLKSLGLMSNLSVQNHVMSIARQQLEELSLDYVPTGKNKAYEISETKDFASDALKLIDDAYTRKSVENNLSIGRLGAGLNYLFEALEDTLSKESNGLSYQGAMNIFRTTSDSKEKNKAVRLMNLYDYKNQTLVLLTNKLDKDVLLSMYNSLKAEANRKGLEVTDKFGRIIHEDLRDYKMLFDGSTESVKHLVKYSSYSGGFEKNVILDALNGDVFFSNKSLANILDKNFFTTKMPNKVVKSIAKLNGLVSKLIMSNPFRYLDRLIGFTLYDLATLGSFEPKTFTKVPVAKNQISAFLQSKYSVISPELKEFLNESGLNLKQSNLQELFSGVDSDSVAKNILDPYFDMFGKGFNIQNMIGRFSYWLAVKEKLDENKNINYGPAYNLKNSIDSLTGKFDEDGSEVVSQNGRKAYFLMSEILGAPGDFPFLSRKLKGLMMFTTFPLAAARFTRGMLGSASVAMKELLVSDDKSGALRWLAGTSLGTAGLFAIPWLIFELWGNLMGLDEEEKEEWKEEKGLPEFVRSIFTGSPVVNKFNTFNQYALLESMTTKPFKDALDEGGNLIDGAGRWILDNIASRGPAPLKLTAEVLGGFDSFGGTIQDTSDQWSMWENFQRKVGGYVIGGSGANALTTYLNKDLKYTDDNFVDSVVKGFRVVLEAEMGNTVAFKTDVKNYYRANSIIQSARFANAKDINYSSNNFNRDDYNDIKSQIGRALRRKAKPSVIYGLIIDAMSSGVQVPELRSAVRNNSLEYKLSQVPDITEFFNNLSESEYKTIVNAINYERQTYPFLNELMEEINSLNKESKNYSSYQPRVYIPRVYNNRNYRNNYSYNYDNFVRNSRFNSMFRIYDPYKAYRASWFKLMNLDKPREE